MIAVWVRRIGCAGLRQPLLLAERRLAEKTT
jgi:hypothetical protein